MWNIEHWTLNIVNRITIWRKKKCISFIGVCWWIKLHCCARYYCITRKITSNSFWLRRFKCALFLFSICIWFWLFSLAYCCLIFNQNEQTIVYIYNIFMNVGETLPFSPILSAIDCCNQIFLLNKIERKIRNMQKNKR